MNIFLWYDDTMKNIETALLDLLYIYGKQAWWPAESDIEMMIGAILVQNTQWENVEKTLSNFNSNFDPHIILNYTPSMLESMIRPSGSYKRKAATIVSLLRWYQNYNFNRDLIESIDTNILRLELLSLHGIGEETCDCILLYAFHRPLFVVDTYLKRLLLKLGYPPMKTYQDYQTFMMNELPPDVSLYQEFHAVIVEYGKNHLKKFPVAVDPLEIDYDYIHYSLKELHATVSKTPQMYALYHKYGYQFRPRQATPFRACIYAIIGQMISSYAAQSIYSRFLETYPTFESINPDDYDSVKSVGLTHSKTMYICDLVRDIKSNRINLEAVNEMEDTSAIAYLASIKGIGIWTATIILIHGYNRLNLTSYDDIALRKALSTIMSIDNISLEQFNAHMRVYSPYMTIASIYLWRLNKDL